MTGKILLIFAFLALILTLILLFNNQDIRAATSSNIQATIKISVCGNGIIEADEQCDGANLGGQTCQNRGFSGGVLSCRPDCAFNTAGCTVYVPLGGGGGGGGGGGYAPPSTPAPVETKVVFEGRAYPLSKVVVLKDGQIAVFTIAGPDANFYVSLTGLSSGNYIFAVYGEDSQGRRSTLFTFPVFITQGATTKISGIFISPTIAVDKNEVKRGDNIAIFGQSAPQAEITIAVNSEEDLFIKTPADKNGVYLYNFDTAPLDIGQHFTKSKAALNGEISSFSKTISFAVGAKTVFAEPVKCPPKADLNNDCKVNLVDFSIAAYWYKRPLSAAFKIVEGEKLNGDGKINLIDFSIMAYYWTG